MNKGLHGHGKIEKKSFNRLHLRRHFRTEYLVVSNEKSE